jgi:methionyl-tRNA formyltransferase
LPDWLAGHIQPQPQDDGQATLAPRLAKEEGRIDWHEPAEKIARRVRAFYPWPGAFTFWQGKQLKILRAAASLETRPKGEASPPGTVIGGPDGPGIVTGLGILNLYEVQPAGKRPMPADTFTHGARGFVGSRLGYNP